MYQAMDVHTLRKRVNAQDKAAAASMPFNEAVKYMVDRYRVDQDSAAAFVRYLSGLDSIDGVRKSNPVEQWHKRFDDEQGRWVFVPDEDEHKPSS